MGKAFTVEERLAIREKIIKVGYELFAKQGIEKVKIREITDQVGIAQGGFYTFFKDKEALVYEILNQVHFEKTQHVLSLLPGTEEDPKEFVREILLHLSKNMANTELYWREKKDILFLITKLSATENKLIAARNKESIQVIKTYWEKHGKIVSIDIEKFLSAMKAVICLAINESFIGEAQFDAILLGTVDMLVEQCIDIN